jgi:ClpP class serine protease
VATSSSVVGSIGVISTYADYTEFLAKAGVKVETFTNKEGVFKSAGSMGNPLNDTQRAEIQSRIDGIFREFKSAVLAKRPQVSDDTMRGQVVYGKDAKKLGLIDAIGDFSYARSVLKKMLKEKS